MYQTASYLFKIQIQVSKRSFDDRVCDSLTSAMTM